jgi:hypothetical protein
MTTPEFTARNVAKFLAKAVVATKTARLTADVVADHTNYEKDDTVVDLGSQVVGWYISAKLEPVTDKIVDTTADFVTEQRNKRQARRDAKKKDQ